MGGRGSSSGRSGSGGISDKQIISEKRKNSSFNSKGEFVMSKFDANYKYKGFGSAQIQKDSNKYSELKGSHVSKDGNNAVIVVDKSNIFTTKYGYGLKVDNEHTVFFKQWQVWGQNRLNGGLVVNFNKEHYDVKKWGQHDDMGESSKTTLNSFSRVAKLAKEQEKYYKKNGIKFTFNN